MTFTPPANIVFWPKTVGADGDPPPLASINRVLAPPPATSVVILPLIALRVRVAISALVAPTKVVGRPTTSMRISRLFCIATKLILPVATVILALILMPSPALTLVLISSELVNASPVSLISPPSPELPPRTMRPDIPDVGLIFSVLARNVSVVVLSF